MLAIETGAYYTGLCTRLMELRRILVSKMSNGFTVIEVKPSVVDKVMEDKRFCFVNLIGLNCDRIIRALTELNDKVALSEVIEKPIVILVEEIPSPHSPIKQQADMCYGINENLEVVILKLRGMRNELMGSLVQYNAAFEYIELRNRQPVSTYKTTQPVL